MFTNLMKSLNKEVVLGLDRGHLLLALGVAGAVGFAGLPGVVTNTLNKEVVGGLDVGHIALGLGLASTLGFGLYRR